MGGAGEKRSKGDGAWVVPRQENVFPFALASKFAFALPCELHQLGDALRGLLFTLESHLGVGSSPVGLSDHQHRGFPR